MNKDNLNVLTQIYNTLLEISTKGEDTIAMSACLQSLYKVIINMKQDVAENIVKE